MKHAIIASVVASLVLPMAAAAAQDRPPLPSSSLRVVQGATSCSAWKTICESRGPGCDAKFRQCLKSGCWTEGAQYGGGTHCGLAKR
jgi:hypothetical protein